MIEVSPATLIPALALCLVSTLGCGESEPVEPPPPPPTTSNVSSNAAPTPPISSQSPPVAPTTGAAQPDVPGAGQPSTPPVGGQTPPAAPWQMPAGVPPQELASPTAPASPASLSGPYELQWIEGLQGRQPMPATLLQQMPGCIWGRWLWDFGEGGNLRVHNELLCEDAQLGTGLCRAEFETRVQWQPHSFIVPSPVTARSQFMSLMPQNGSWEASGGSHNTTTIRCNVNLSNVRAQLTDVIPGQAPNRPQAVTLDIGNGERVHLVATTTEVDYAQIVYQHHAGGR